MGLSVSVESENWSVSDEVGDPTNILHRILPDVTNDQYVCVNVIDWYGNTVFNHLQMPRFLDEWTQLEGAVATGAVAAPDAASLLSQIRRLAEKVRDGIHIYLVFRGD